MPLQALPVKTLLLTVICRTDAQKNRPSHSLSLATLPVKTAPVSPVPGWKPWPRHRCAWQPITWTSEPPCTPMPSLGQPATSTSRTRARVQFTRWTAARVKSLGALAGWWARSPSICRSSMARADWPLAVMAGEVAIPLALVNALATVVGPGKAPALSDAITHSHYAS